MSVETKGGSLEPPQNSKTSEMDTDSAIKVNNRKNSNYKLSSVCELSPDNEGQYSVACWHCSKINIIKKFHEWHGLQTKLKQLNCRFCNKRSAVKCFLKISPNISNGHLVNSINEINVYSCNINVCKINKIDCRKCEKQINVKYMPIMGLQNEEMVTCECGTVNKLVSEYKETSKIQQTSAKPSQDGSRHTTRRTPRHPFSGTIITTRTLGNETATAARTPIDILPTHGDEKVTISSNLRAHSMATSSHETVYVRAASLASQQPPEITTCNRFSLLPNEEEHKDESEREDDNAFVTFTTPKPKKRKRDAVTPDATVTQRQPRRITQSTHIPDIIITDVKKINDPEYLKKIRKISTEHGARHVMAPNKRNITIRVYNGEIRTKIIEELEKLDGTLRFVARVPKAQQTHQTKVVLNSNIYDETNEACLEEMERCIGVRPIKMRTIKGNLHLFIFDGAHPYEEIATLMKTTKHAYFGALSMKPQQYKYDPRRVIQCKRCFLFTHATSACHGERKNPTLTTQNEEGEDIEICTACKKPGHGATQFKCVKFQKAVERQIAQHKEKENKQREATERRHTAYRCRQENDSYANIASTSEFPPLPQRAPQTQSNIQPPTQANEHTTNNENSIEPLERELQITLKQILIQLQLQHQILIKILNK